jgi:NhaP-type Na+/H+ or K+/H+ antiporter
MDESIVLKVALIGVLGIGSQWLAWRLQLPAIVLMAVAGVMAGPVLGILSPVEDFGHLLRPMVAVAVAIILFEGGLNLSVRELKGVSKAVWRLVILGVPIGWLLGSLTAHFLAGLSWPVAVLFAGILVVTGPTVIIPLLRQAKLAARPAAIL